MEFNETWQEARSQRPLPSLCFRAYRKQAGHPGLWLAETFSTSLKLLNRIQRNLTGSKISTSSTKFVFFRLIGKTRWLPQPLICWDISNFSSETVELNSTTLDRKQDLNVLYQVCVFRANWTNKMAAPASNWPRHFVSPAKHSGTKGSLCPVSVCPSVCPSVCLSSSHTILVVMHSYVSQAIFAFLGMLPLCFTSPDTATLNLMNFNRKQNQNFLYQVCVFVQIRKTRWPPEPLICRDIFDFSSEIAECNSF